MKFFLLVSYKSISCIYIFFVVVQLICHKFNYFMKSSKTNNNFSLNITLFRFGCKILFAFICNSKKILNRFPTLLFIQ